MSLIKRKQTYYERTEGRRIDGRWIDGAVVKKSFLGTIQPARSSDYERMEALSEGRRIESLIRVYTNTLFNVAGESTKNGDLVEWRGEFYLITQISPWQSGLISHNRYIGVRDESFVRPD